MPSLSFSIRNNKIAGKFERSLGNRVERCRTEVKEIIFNNQNCREAEILNIMQAEKEIR